VDCKPLTSEDNHEGVGIVMNPVVAIVWRECWKEVSSRIV